MFTKVAINWPVNWSPCTPPHPLAATLSSVFFFLKDINSFLLFSKKMKYLNVSETIQKALKREVQVMKNMNSPAIIKLYDSFQIDQFLYIVMEYSPLGDLESQIKKKAKGFDIDEVSHFMTEIAVGLRVLRSKSIMHRDLKPANILLFPDPLAPFGVKFVFGFSGSIGGVFDWLLFVQYLGGFLGSSCAILQWPEN